MICSNKQNVLGCVLNKIEEIGVSINEEMKRQSEIFDLKVIWLR